MHIRIALGLLIFAVACGPDVHSTSATLGGTGGDASAEGGSACPTLGPGYDAWIDALDRSDTALGVIEAEIAAAESQLALLLGLPADATNDEIAAALAALYAAVLEGGVELVAGPTRCTGSIATARDNLAICMPDADVASINFDCEGACTVPSLDECPSGVATCRDAATVAACSGACRGECILEAGSACEGVCMGVCDGNCHCTPDGDECMGPCTGACTGSCELVDGQCDGECAGECESIRDACDAGDWLCLDDGAYCSLECDSWATPGEGAELCPETAAFAGAASMTCSQPRVRLNYATQAITMCFDFVMTAAAIESAATQLLRTRAHLLALGDARGEFADAIFDSIAPALIDGESEPCVAEAFIALDDRTSAIGQRVADDAAVVDALLGAIGFAP